MVLDRSWLSVWSGVRGILCVYQIGTLITTGAFGIGTVVAFLLIIGFIYLLFRPYKESTTLKVDTEKAA